MNEGLVDTNVFIHAHANDAHTEECRTFLLSLEAGNEFAVLEPTVLHELSYAWSHYFRGMPRQEIGDYLLTVVTWAGIRCDKALLAGTVMRWRDSSLGFVDCLLAERASLESVPVYTKNVRDLRSQGVDVPDPLPG